VSYFSKPSPFAGIAAAWKVALTTLLVMMFMPLTHAIVLRQQNGWILTYAIYGLNERRLGWIIHMWLCLNDKYQSNEESGPRAWEYFSNSTSFLNTSLNGARFQPCGIFKQLI